MSCCCKFCYFQIDVQFQLNIKDEDIQLGFCIGKLLPSLPLMMSEWVGVETWKFLPRSSVIVLRLRGRKSSLSHFETLILILGKCILIKWAFHFSSQLKQWKFPFEENTAAVHSSREKSSSVYSAARCHHRNRLDGKGGFLLKRELLIG